MVHLFFVDYFENPISERVYSCVDRRRCIIAVFGSHGRHTDEQVAFWTPLRYVSLRSVRNQQQTAGISYDKGKSAESVISCHSEPSHAVSRENPAQIE